MENTTINTEAEDMPMNPIPEVQVNPYFYLNFYLFLILFTTDIAYLLGAFTITLFLVSMDYFFNKKFNQEYNYMKIGTALIIMGILVKIIWLPEICQLHS